MNTLPLTWPTRDLPAVNSPDDLSITGNYLLLHRWPPEQKAGKIILPDAARRDWDAAWIELAGPDAKTKGFDKGQSVLFNPAGWAPLPILGEDFGYLHADDVILHMKTPTTV